MTDRPLILFLTPLSHFSRKVRVVVEELGLACELRYVPNLLSSDAADFGGNPILRVPVLLDGDVRVVESDAICRHLVETRDTEGDRLGFFDRDVERRNALAFLAAVMGAEVEILLAGRAGLDSGPAAPFFGRYHRVIRDSLAWIESEGERLWPEGFSWLDVVLISAWDHLRHSKLVPPGEAYPWIEARTARFADRPSIRSTAPAAMQELQWQLYPEQRPR